MDIVERRTVKENGHYVVPLTFHDQELVMPSNKQQAVKRLMGLKRRFIRDNRFFLDYKKYMNDLLEKGVQEDVMKHQLERLGTLLIMQYTSCV